MMKLSSHVWIFVQVCLLFLLSAVNGEVTQLAGSLSGSTLEHTVNLNDSRANGQDSVTIKLIVPKVAWVAVGFSTDGKMVGSEAVIGNAEFNSVMKYSMTAKSPAGINEMDAAQQTLIDTDISQSDSETVLTFTKILVEPNEIAIDGDGANIFIVAHGSSNAVGFHTGYGPVDVTLSSSPTAPVAAPVADPTVAPTVAPDDGDSTPVDVPPGFDLLNLKGGLVGSTFMSKVDLAEGTITVVMTIPSAAWVGVGASEQGLMVGSEVVIGLPDTGSVKKYRLTAQATTGIEEMPEEQQTLINTDISQSGGKTTLTYTKLLDEEGEITINGDGDTVFIAAYGFGNALSFHAQEGAFTLSGQEIERDDSPWVLHGSLAYFAWGIFCPLAIISGLFRSKLPGNKLWFNIHRGLNTLVVLLTIAVFVIAYTAIEKDTPEGADASHFSSDIVDGHRFYGLIILILALIQGLGGILRPHVPEDGEEKTAVRKFWEVFHRLLGIALLGFCWYQIHLGILWYYEIFDKEGYETARSVFWGISGTLGGIKLIGVIMRCIGK